MSDPVLKGNLRAFPLSDIFLMLNNNHKTGAFRCVSRDTTKTVEWENGEVVFARSTSPEDRLGSYLLSRGKVTPAQLKKADPRVGSQARLGKALVALGALTPSELWNAVRGQVHEIIYSLFHWKEGEFDFREVNPSREKISLESSVMSIIMEGTRRLDEWSQVKEKIPNDQVVLTPVKSLQEITKSVKLSEIEKKLFSLVDGKRNVQQVAALSGHGDFDSWQALFSLQSAGLIRPQVLTFHSSKPDPQPDPPQEDDLELERTLDQYGGAVEKLFARAAEVGGPSEIARIRKQLRKATFAEADLLREVAVEPDGRIDRRILLANVADHPPGERARALQRALEHLLQQVIKDLQGKIQFDDVIADLDSGEPG